MAISDELFIGNEFTSDVVITDQVMNEIRMLEGVKSVRIEEVNSEILVFF